MSNLTEQHIERLWQRMAQLYGRKWINDHGDHDVDNIWLKTLSDITPDMVARGLKKCTEHNKTWPPTLMEFRDHCLGFPNKELAKKLAIDNKPTTDPFILHMRRLIGSWVLSHGTYAELERHAENAYAHVTKLIQDDQVIRLESQRRRELGYD